MIWIMLILSTLGVKAAQPIHWGYLIELSHQHEFYKKNEPIIKPKESWQNLFAFTYLDRDLKQLKDCVFYKVPGEGFGTLKIKTIYAFDKCDDYVLKPGDKEWPDIKALQFNTHENTVTFDISFKSYRSEKWLAKFQKAFTKPSPVMNLSSAEFKSPKTLLLAPHSSVIVASKPGLLKPDFQCHQISEYCEEVKPSVCDQCPEGWYEIPNGCFQGPKFCGHHLCGKKGKPACRRGMVWQRTESKFDCRIDSSFAYCEKGLTVQCEGQKAFCR